MRVTLGALRAHFWHTGVTWGVLWRHFVAILACEGDFGWTLGQLWGHLWHMNVPLGPRWGHFGGSLGSLGSHFEIALDHCVFPLGIFKLIFKKHSFSQ